MTREDRMEILTDSRELMIEFLKENLSLEYYSSTSIDSAKISLNLDGEEISYAYLWDTNND